MHRIVSRRPSPATIISLVALFVALGGTGYAAVALAPKNTVGSAQVINGSLQKIDLSKEGGQRLEGQQRAARPRRCSGRSRCAGPAGPPARRARPARPVQPARPAPWARRARRAPRVHGAAAAVALRRRGAARDDGYAGVTPGEEPHGREHLTSRQPACTACHGLPASTPRSAMARGRRTSVRRRASRSRRRASYGRDASSSAGES